MKVGIDVSAAVYGTGVSDYTVELVHHLSHPGGVQVIPVGFSLRRRRELISLFPGVTTYPIPPTVLHYLWNKLHIYNFENFAPGNIDVYHSSDWAQAPDSNPKVTTVHDLAPFLYSGETSPQIVSVHTARLNWVVRDCDRIICVSQSTETDLLRLFPKTRGRTVVIPEALPTRYLHTPRPSPHKDYIVTIGARQGRKNIPRLISAFSTYKSKYRLPEKLIIIGESAHVHPGGVQGRSGDEIFFTGYVSDQELVNYLGHAAAFVYPSL